LIVVPFFSHQIPFDVEDEWDSDDTAESQNEDDQPSSGPTGENEGKVDIKLNCFRIVDISFMQLGLNSQRVCLTGCMYISVIPFNPFSRKGMNGMVVL
jgi:hypothetical protein